MKIAWYHIKPLMGYRCLTVCVPAWWLLAAAVPPVVAQPPVRALVVYAASDLGPALQKIVPPFEKMAHAKVTVSLGSSGTLAQQIRNGAPADVFFAANESFVDGLIPDGLVLPQSRLRYARGRIVLITVRSSPVRITSLQDLADPKVRRIAIANPAHAPYGLAAQQALEASGLWKLVQPKLVFGENVQQAVQFVRSGSVEAGIVARSVAEGPDLAWELVDDKLYAPVNQMAAIVTRTKDPALARSFLDFVDGEQGRSVMRQLGFLLPGEHF
jgi:molybdate transport system substrate-binding protein